MTTIEELKQLLKFALDNLRYEIPYEDPESEYDHCSICGKPDWDHTKDCKAIQWEKRVKEILQ